ncbi:M15 family metallopeptidase [Paralimibaculum aggregatum]|uniref:M15 family metallopeptidase n=1 Tax=Paralimibaculum aggregatum TaxID=3036245 RepID=A0ABQ6LH81_9RHOB|nr:M15 family metallopeptidase [Limibaculum sp. NKW23]GMG81590.1 M15 family metallopeptidase [Limibaculum sp. NKW23]
MKVNIGLVILALAVLAAPVVWHLAEAEFGGDDRVAELEGQITALRQQVNDSTFRLDAMEDTVRNLEARSAAEVLSRAYPTDQAGPISEEEPQDEEGGYKENFAQVVLVADRRSFNRQLTHATPNFLKEFLGLPREELSDNCEEMTNETLKEMLELADVGPIKVRMLRPAIVSLQQIFKNVQVYEPELYARIKSSGSLCVRRIRGSEDRASAHAYGLAVDLNIDGQLDTLGDGKTQLGLVLLSEIFNREGWIWGAGFGREDSMHFEVSRELLERWRRRGDI